jgi:diguanylate cyclase (GGDEF)-like protein
MREDMATFFSNQLDFIFFFYGLAFILLGATCLAIARSRGRAESWAVLGWFAIAHGAGEWLDLTALILGDTPAFAVARTALMTGSFVLLMEFARLEAIRFGMRLPGRWIYVLLVLLVGFAGVWGGLTVSGVVARYAIGFVGAAGTSLVLVRQARALSGQARFFSILAAAGFALYAVAAGAVVPTAPFWPASAINYNWFAGLTGAPIQLVRGLLACCISFSIWAIWGQQLASEVASPRYTAHVRQQFAWTLVTMATILICGWTLTEFLGGIYRQNVQYEARGDIDLLASRLAGETAMVDGMVKALAGSPSILPLLTGGNPQDNETAKSVLDLDVEASGAKRGYILDMSGMVVASSSRREALPGAPNYTAASYFQKSIAGEAGHHFAFDAASGARDYYASHPIHAKDGHIIGVAVLTKSLDTFEADLRQFDRPYFFIDPDGIVVMTNHREQLLRPFWQLPADKKAALAQQFGTLDGRPMIEQEVADATWANVDGERNYIRRRFADHSEWSLVILKPTREIFASRVLGIVITLLVAIMALIYLLGRSRWIHDRVQMDNRLRLQELARDLGYKATTDALTGLPNRLKFDQALADEMLRAARYKTPLSLVLYDVDHFKQVNDTFGHQVGDHVLTELSRLVPNLIRSTDLLARWGGEEFVILVPGCDGPMAFAAAQKLRAAIGQREFAEVGSVTCSFGVAQYAPGETAEAFIARADDALYRAKINGRNQVVLGPPPAGAKLELVSVA